MVIKDCMIWDARWMDGFMIYDWVSALLDWVVYQGFETGSRIMRHGIGARHGRHIQVGKMD